MTPLQPQSWQQGFDLLCWSLHEGPAQPDEFRQLAASLQQWDGFITQLQWHRVASHAWRRLEPFRQQLPADVLHALQSGRQQTAALAMKHSQELIRLASHFTERKIPFVVLKGVPLSLHLYQDAGRRFSRDIDILVQPERVDDAQALLTDCGYALTYPSPALPAIIHERYRTLRKDCTLTHRRHGTAIELHWRLNDNPHFLPLSRLNPFHSSSSVVLGGQSIPVLQDECNALYLIMHATHSAWARLSWLTDIAALMRRPTDWPAVFALARQLGVEAAVRVTLQLAHELLAAPLPSPEIPDSWRARYLLEQGRMTLASARYPTPARVLLQRMMHCRRANFLDFLLRKEMGISLNDIALLPLPEPLTFLYYPLRPLLWAWRHSIGPANRMTGQTQLQKVAP